MEQQKQSINEQTPKRLKTEKIAKNKQDNKNDKRKLVKAIIMDCAILITILIAVLSPTTLGWFVKSSETNAQGIALETIKPNELTVEVSYYKVSSTQDDNVYFTSTTDKVMPKFSILKSENTQFLLKFNLTYESPSSAELNKNIKFSVNTQTTYFMDGTTAEMRNDGTPDDRRIADTYDNSDPALKEQNKLTSIVDFKFFESVSQNEDDLYYLAKTQHDMQSFVEKNAENKLTIANGQIVFSENTDMEFFVLIDYNFDHIQELMTANIGNPALTANLTLDKYFTFGCDFQFKIELV